MDKNFKLKSFVVKPSQCIISNELGDKVVEPRVMQLLVELARAKGKIVSRTELFNSIWKEQVVSDYALNTLVANLRKNLGDKADSPIFIETRPKLGYRLIPKVEPVDQKNSVVESVEEKNQRIGFRSWSLLVSVAVLALITIFYLINSNSFYSFGRGSNQSSSLISTEANGEVVGNDVNSQNPSQVIIQHRYLSRVNISVDSSELNDVGVPICINTEADFFTKLIFSNNSWFMKDYKWTLYSDFFDLKFHHNQQELAGISELHDFEHGHPYGVVKEKLTISFDEAEDFTGSSNWSVYGFDDKLLCAGSSIFIARKI